MKKYLLLLLACASRLALAQAQAPDIMLRTDGSEVPGRVLSITPLELRYLPPTGGDTLRLAVADVFLVRYANGTREVLHPAPSSPAPSTASDLLPGLSESQRRNLGRQTATRAYTDTGPFWGALGASLYGGPLLGLVAPGVMASHTVSVAHLKAPRPELLADPAYGSAYRKEAQKRKRGRAWGGYALGATGWLVLIGALTVGGN